MNKATPSFFVMCMTEEFEVFGQDWDLGGSVGKALTL